MRWYKNTFIYGWMYRVVMKTAHKFNWHYAPPIYPNGDTQLWCKWCGFRQTIRRKDYVDVISTITSQEETISSACKNVKEKSRWPKLFS